DDPLRPDRLIVPAERAGHVLPGRAHGAGADAGRDGPVGMTLVGEPEPGPELAGAACPRCGEAEIEWLPNSEAKSRSGRRAERGREPIAVRRVETQVGPILSAGGENVAELHEAQDQEPSGRQVGGVEAQGGPAGVDRLSPRPALGGELSQGKVMC